MKKSLGSIVRQRARNCCEYCCYPAEFSSTPFQIDHVIAAQHGGKTSAENLAFACFACNHHKGPNLAGIDPKTGKRSWLFNPRRHKWKTHFQWKGPKLAGRTPTGRTTIAVLGINLPHRIAQRAALLEESVFPVY